MRISTIYINALVSVILETYYISGLGNFLKLVNCCCSTFQKAYSRLLNQRMGMLPLLKSTPAPPFQCTGIDCEGPVYIRQGKVCKPTRVKCYACLLFSNHQNWIHWTLCRSHRRGIYGSFSSLHSSKRYSSTPFAQILLVFTMKFKVTIVTIYSHSYFSWRYQNIPTIVLYLSQSLYHGGLWEAGVKCIETLLRKLMSP